MSGKLVLNSLELTWATGRPCSALPSREIHLLFMRLNIRIPYVVHKKTVSRNAVQYVTEPRCGTLPQARNILHVHGHARIKASALPHIFRQADRE